MSKKTKKRSPASNNLTDELLKKILITQLSLAKVPQKEIARIVETSKSSVNRVAKYVKVPK